MKFKSIPAPTAIEIFGETYAPAPDGTFVVPNDENFVRWANLQPLYKRRLREVKRFKVADLKRVRLESTREAVRSIIVAGRSYFADEKGEIEVPDVVALAYPTEVFEAHGVHAVAGKD